MLALDSGNTAVLMLIDLSAVFDSVDHDTLLQRLHISYDLGGSVLAWFTSYLSSLIVLCMCVYLLPGRIESSSVWCAIAFGLWTYLFLLNTSDLLGVSLDADVSMTAHFTYGNYCYSML